MMITVVVTRSHVNGKGEKQVCGLLWIVGAIIGRLRMFSRLRNKIPDKGVIGNGTKFLD